MFLINYFHKLENSLNMLEKIKNIQQWINSNSKKISYILYALSIVLAFQIYKSITGPINFNKIKNERYLKVIDRMKDIRNAQIAFKSVNGIYSNNFEELVKFVDSAQFTIVEKRDSSFMQYDRVYRIDMLKEVVVIDTLGYVSVKDSLFADNLIYKNMAMFRLSELMKNLS